MDSVYYLSNRPGCDSYIVSSVGGTCGGTLKGNYYTLNPVTANCTVAASFVAQTAIPAANYNVDIGYVPAGQGGAGQVASLGYPSGKALGYQYDATGQLTGLSWNGQALLTNIVWTPLGVPKGWTWAFVQGSPSASRTYDTAGKLTGNGIASYSYDAAGRV